jgi:caa(3)-type oxidase subunit IV
MHDPEHRGPGGTVPVSELDHHLRDYWKIIVTLTVATGIEFGISGLMAGADPKLGMSAGILLLVAVAFFKAVLVAKFFMHLKYDPRILAILAVTPLVLATPLNVICIFEVIKGPSIGM